MGLHVRAGAGPLEATELPFVPVKVVEAIAVPLRPEGLDVDAAGVVAKDVFVVEVLEATSER